VAERDVNSAPSGPFFSTQEQQDSCHHHNSNPQAERELATFRTQKQHQPALPLPPLPPPPQQQQHRARGGFDMARLQALVPPEMRAGHQATTSQSSQGMGSIAIADNQSEASMLTSSQQGSSQDDIALLQLPSMEEEEEPEKHDKGPCRLLHEEKNCKKTLMSLLVGLESEDGGTLGDAFQEPHFSMKQRAQHVINNEHLQTEIETQPACSPERWPSMSSAPMSRSRQRGGSTNSNDNRHTNVNCEVLQPLPKELEEHKTINNKDGIEQNLCAVCGPCTGSSHESTGLRKIQSATSTSLVWFGKSPPVWMGFLPKPFCPHR